MHMKQTITLSRITCVCSTVCGRQVSAHDHILVEDSANASVCHWTVGRTSHDSVPTSINTYTSYYTP